MELGFWAHRSSKFVQIQSVGFLQLQSINRQRASSGYYLPWLQQSFWCCLLCIPIEKLKKHGLNEQTIKWIENWLNDWIQMVIIISMKSSWRPIRSSIPHGSLLGLILFNILINDEVECTLIRFAEDTKLGEEADTPEGDAFCSGSVWYFLVFD